MIVRILGYVVIALLVVGLVLYVGKTSFGPGGLKVQRPLTAIFALLALVCAIFLEKN